MKKFLSALVCSIYFLGLSLGGETDHEQIVKERRLLKNGIVTYELKINKYDDNPSAVGVNNVIKVTFLNDLFKSEFLKESTHPEPSAILGLDFLLYENGTIKQKSSVLNYKRRKDKECPIVLMGLLDPRSFGLAVTPFCTIGIDKIRNVIGSNNVVKSGLTGPDDRGVRVRKSTNSYGTAITETYDSANNLIEIETNIPHPDTKKPYRYISAIEYSKFKGTSYPKKVDLKIIHDTKITYHEEVLVKSAIFNTDVKETDFVMSAIGYPNGTDVVDRDKGVGMKLLNDTLVSPGVTRRP